MAGPRGKEFILSKERREAEPQAGDRGVKTFFIMGVAIFLNFFSSKNRERKGKRTSYGTKGRLASK